MDCGSCPPKSTARPERAARPQRNNRPGRPAAPDAADARPPRSTRWRLWRAGGGRVSSFWHGIGVSAGKLKHPSSNIQRSFRLQLPTWTLVSQLRFRWLEASLEPGVWDLELLWMLDIGAWCFTLHCPTFWIESLNEWLHSASPLPDSHKVFP